MVISEEHEDGDGDDKVISEEHDHGDKAIQRHLDSAMVLFQNEDEEIVKPKTV